MSRRGRVGGAEVDASNIFYPPKILYYIKKNALQMSGRRVRRNSYLQAVCDTPISRVLRVVCPH